MVVNRALVFGTVGFACFSSPAPPLPCLHFVGLVAESVCLLSGDADADDETVKVRVSVYPEWRWVRILRGWSRIR